MNCFLQSPAGLVQLKQEIDKLFMNSEIREIKSRLSNENLNRSTIRSKQNRTIEDYKRDAMKYQTTPKRAYEKLDISFKTEAGSTSQKL